MIRPPSRLAAFAFAFALALASGASGCATAGQRRAERLARQLDALRYPRPTDEVWDAVRRLLAERGYPLAAEDAKAIGLPEPGLAKRLSSPARKTHPLDDPGLLQQLGIVGKGEGGPPGRTLETGWRLTEDRYRADAVEEADGVRVVLTRFVYDGVDRLGKPERDPALELELARRLAPEAAARIEATAAP